MPIDNRIKQIMAPSIPMVAVYYCEEVKSLFRDPVIYLALWDVPDCDDCTAVTPCNIGKDGFGDACEDCINLLGYEYNNKGEDWDEEIADYLRKEQRRKAKKNHKEGDAHA